MSADILWSNANSLYNEKFWAFPEFIITPSLVVKLSTTTMPDLNGLGPYWFEFGLNDWCRSETLTTTANDDGSGVYRLRLSTVNDEKFSKVDRPAR